jgi:HEXXH motif-containing protein
LPHAGPALLRSHSWYERYFPSDKESRASPIYFGIADTEFAAFSDALASGAELVHRFWPEAWSELIKRIHTIAPLEPTGLRPHNSSVSGFRGLITTSGRPTYLAAQTLVHETGHNKFSSICDLFRLFENEDGVEAYSPFVKMQRPLSAVAHGIFSFIQDIHISMRLRGHVTQIAELSLDRYIDRTGQSVTTALDNLKRTAILTERGQQLVVGFERAVAASYNR